MAYGLFQMKCKVKLKISILTFIWWWCDDGTSLEHDLKAIFWAQLNRTNGKWVRSKQYWEV